MKNLKKIVASTSLIALVLATVAVSSFAFTAKPVQAFSFYDFVRNFIAAPTPQANPQPSYGVSDQFAVDVWRAHQRPQQHYYLDYGLGACVAR